MAILRNCDRFKTFDDALAAFLKWCPCERDKDATCDGCQFENSYSCASEWLMTKADETTANPQMSLGI